MVRPRRPLSWRLLVPVVGLLAVAGVGAQMSRAGSLLVHQCVADGGLGWLGLRLALLRPDTACPSGTLAVGGDQRQVIAVVVSVAAPALVAHLAGVLLGVGVLGHLRRLARAVRAALRGVRASLPDDVPRLPVGARVAIDVVPQPPVVRNAPLVPWWRGPPAPQSV